MRSFCGRPGSALPENENRLVSSFWNLDADRIPLACLRVVFDQPRPQTTHLDADHGINFGIVVARPAEHLKGEQRFFQRSTLTIETLLDEKTQEPGAAVGA